MDVQKLGCDFFAFSGKVKTEFYSVEPITADEATSKGKLGDSALSQEEWAALVALLGGHRYAMDLAALWPQSDRSDNWESRLSLVSQSAETERLLWCQSRISPPNLMNLLAETRKLKHSGKYWLRDH